mgnify:CR=1 FL=1
MKRVFKQHSVVVLLAVASVITGAEIGWWWMMRGQEQKDEKRLAAQRRELLSLQNAEPAPTPESAESLKQQVRQAEEKLAALKSEWFESDTVKAWQKQKVPTDRRAAYFDVANYRQRMTALAKREQVALAKIEAFGFTAYVNEGPVETDIARVFRQRLVLEKILSALLRSRPTSLSGVAREAEKSAPNVRRTRGSDEVDPLPDVFSVRREGMIAAQVFEFRFIGRTAVLREWLNALAKSDLPVVVRNVIVQPAAALATRSQAVMSGIVLDATDEGFKPLVSPGDSEFIVSIEYLEWIKPTDGEEGES